MKRVLWISGRLPTPLFAGDALYSAGVLKALALTGKAEISVVGTRRDDRPSDGKISLGDNIACIDLPKAQGSLPRAVSGLFRGISRDASALATPAVSETLARLMEQSWDWIVIDHANSSGLIEAVVKNRGHASICYLAHNAEGKARPEIAMKVENVLRRSIMRLDAENYRRLERKVIEAADIVLCITDTDAEYFSRFHKDVHVIPPVYLGAKALTRMIDDDCPRSVLLVGSFDWVAKQENLERIVKIIVPILRQNGITLEVVGSVPENLRTRLSAEIQNVKFHGRVADLTALFAAARGGLVAEDLGGGFKLKVLDYAFNRVPIFGLKDAMQGTTTEEQSAMLLADDMASLGMTIAQNMDNLPRLNHCQTKLFDLVSERFGMKAGVDRLNRALFKSGQDASAVEAIDLRVG